MLSKLICAAMIGTAASHSIQTRQAPKEPYYTKVNRDSEYGAPSAPSYSAPAPSYNAPAPSYSAPAAPSYSAPEASYGAPSTGYGAAPSYGVEEEAGLDLTSIIIPLLALVGLSLLFPTYVSLTTVRKRRDTGETEGNLQRPIFQVFFALFVAATATPKLHIYTPTCTLPTQQAQICTANLFAAWL
jgi:hypothetical protein